jgi:hypothetical protein
MKSFLSLAGAALLAAASLEAQTSEKKASLFKDPEDGAFDVGGWIGTRTGILPIPMPITELAIGYGGALGLVWIHGGGMAGLRDAPPGVTGKPVTPDISAVAGAGTENGTWAAALAHVGFWKGDRWRYTGAVARISPKLDTYDAAGNAYLFNLDGWAVYQELRRRIGRTNLFLGARFVFMDSTTTFESGRLPPDIPNPQFDTRDSGLGAVPSRRRLDRRRCDQGPGGPERPRRRLWLPVPDRPRPRHPGRHRRRSRPREDRLLRRVRHLLVSPETISTGRPNRQACIHATKSPSNSPAFSPWP